MWKVVGRVVAGRCQAESDRGEILENGQQQHLWELTILTAMKIVNSYRKSQQDVIVYQNLLFHIYMKLNSRA
jgi:hypothetical protein